MQLFTDQDGILRRFINEAPDWNEHLVNTKQTIIDFIKKYQAKSVSILGSGWMLDIPVQFLADEMEKVVFYDLRHPRGIINKYERNRNFHFVTMDLTGGLIEKIYHLCHQKKKPTVQELEHELYIDDIALPVETECYVSANILNQLDILLVDYLKLFFNLTDENIRQLRETIQLSHLNFLEKYNSCLITDFEEIHLNDDDEIIGHTPLVYTSLPQGEIENSWIWHFDTNKTYSLGHKTFMKVTAIY